MKRIFHISTILLLIMVPTTYISSQSNLYYLLGGELWPSPETGGHAIALLAWESKNITKKSLLRITFNSDTLSAQYTKKTPNKWEAGIRIEGEYKLAGLLSDYYKQGEKITSRSFYASYLDIGAHLTYLFNDRNNVRIDVTRKQWFFTKKDSTATEFVLPPDHTAAKIGISYTHWSLKNDPSFYEPHRLFLRSEGLAFGIRSEINLRTKINQWGQTQSGQFINNRNDPSSISLFLHQWLRYGSKISRLFLLGIVQQSGLGLGSDDITRFRLGGLNPYVAPLAGAPWAGFITDQFFSLQIQWNAQISHRNQLGLFVDFAGLKDINRDGNNSWGSSFGLGMLLDIRWGNQQLDFRAGYTLPAKWQKEKPFLSFFLTFGGKIGL